jgi:hypothetical protein
MSWRRYLATVPLALAVLFSWLFYIRYWKWRESIHEVLSSCVTPDGDNLTAGGMVWAIFALAFAGAALRLLTRK